MYLVIFWLLGLAVGVISILTGHLSGVAAISHELLFYQLVITVSIAGIFGFVGHVFKSDMVAKQIGWPQKNPFQKEIGWANLSYGIAALAALFMHKEYWLAVIVMFSVYYIGAAFVHIKEMITNHNFHLGNGFMTIPDIFLPLFLITLYCISN